ncbi:unnamed protein product [Prorocentrum cordatum]|uniref:Uncharacterized protein n=1 Tax=Prorocentrum cordatum TaxID=2364126 RepID=A0ABN9X8Y8_9DINO|nr:unnamed protein product [Polarella glacialis]
MPTWLERGSEGPRSEAKHARGSSVQAAKGGNKFDRWEMALLMTIAKMVLPGARQIASLEGTVYETYFAKEELPTTRNRTQKLKEHDKAGETIDYKARGAPYVQVYNMVIRRVLDKIGPDGPHKDEAQYRAEKSSWDEVVMKRPSQTAAMDVLHLKYKRASKSSRQGVLSLAVSVRGRIVAGMWAIVLEYTDDRTRAAGIGETHASKGGGKGNK